jgi:hypothetical protein
MDIEKEMGLFGKKKSSGGTIDFTYLQKRGLLPEQKQHKYSVKMPTTNDGMVDLGALANTNSNSTISNSNATESSGAFGFLSNLAGSTPSIQPENSRLSSTSEVPTEAIREVRQKRLVEFNAMKLKIDDLEYKLERSLERIAQLESNIEQFKR